MVNLLIAILTTLFIYLKLVGSVSWSWLWVLSPIWIGIPLQFIVGLLLLMLIAILSK